MLPENIQNLNYLKRQIFIQSNPLVEAIFIQNFKELELKTLCLISKYINENKYVHEIKTLQDVMANYMKITIRKEDFCKSLKTNPLNFYKQMQGLANELTNKKIKLRNPENNKFAIIVLFSGIAYENGNAIFYINCLMAPYLQHLKSNFTVMSLEYISNLKSAYAIKLYQLLKQYEMIKKRTFEIEELKHMLGTHNEYLDNFKHFKQNVLIVSQKHINASTDLKISFKTIKKGRIIHAIEFKIEIQKPQFQQSIEIFTNELDLLLNSEKLNKFLASDLKHSFIQKNWKESKKDISNTNNFFLFEIWLKNRVLSYHASSSKVIELSPIGTEMLPEWYADCLRKLNKIS